MSLLAARWQRVFTGIALLLSSAVVWAQPQPWKAIESAAIDDPKAALQTAQTFLQQARSDMATPTRNSGPCWHRRAS